jgi:hypothetical protein
VSPLQRRCNNGDRFNEGDIGEGDLFTAAELHVKIAPRTSRAPIDGSRFEKNVESFYRFPIFPNVDTALSDQSVINPALNREVDQASVFSLRFRAAF